MAHNEGPRLNTTQQLQNAIYTTQPPVPAFNVAQAGYTYSNITTSAQNVIKSSAGILGRVALNSTLISAVRGYDNTVSGGNILFTIPSGTTPTTFSYDVRFTTGLVVSSGAGADNLTIMFN